MAAYDCITDLPPPSRTWDGAEEGEMNGRKQPQTVVTWSGGALPQAGRFMVVAVSQAASMLLQYLPETAMLGKLGHPATAIKDSQESGPSAAASFSVSSWGSEDSIVLGISQGRVASSEAVSWAHAIFDSCKPERILILDSLLYRNFHSGHGRYVLDDAPVFQLLTDAQKASERNCSSIPFLPSGSLVEGLSAALLSHCQVRNIPAKLLINLQQGPRPDIAALNALASALNFTLEESVVDSQSRHVWVNSSLQNAKQNLGHHASQPLVSEMFV